MTFKIKQRNGSEKYGVTPFDDETGESLSEIFGTKILATLALAVAYAENQVKRIQALGDAASFEIIA